jgi:SAM-dependent methyltransferase
VRKLSCPFVIACFALLILTAPILLARETRHENERSGLQGPEPEISTGITQESVQESLQTNRIVVADDDSIWEDFAQWVESLPRLPPGERASLKDLYIKRLVVNGVSVEEAQRRLALIRVLRSKTLDHERIYWDGKHKLGDAPFEPLALVRNAVSGLHPGKALDVAMGNGRHSIYLASIGWEATGYDFSPESVRRANALAAKAGVKIRAVRATHDTFDFGESQWDLIVIAYPYYETMDPTWPPHLWRATKQNGLVVFQGVAEEGCTPVDFVQLWHPFHLVHCEILDHGEDWFEDSESRTVKIIAHKK